MGQQLVADGAAIVYQINDMTLRQTITPSQLLGRVNAGVRTAGLGAALFASIGGGLMGELIGLRSTLAIGACGGALAALWLTLSPVRSLRRATYPGV